MQAIATLLIEDPFTKLSTADRVALAKARRQRFWSIPVKVEIPEPAEPEVIAKPARKNPWFIIVSDQPIPGSEPKIDDILRACCEYFDLTRSQMTSARRTALVVYARQIAMYLCKLHTTKSYPEIGRRLGGRDHTTVMHGFRKVEANISKDWLLAYDVAYAEAML